MKNNIICIDLTKFNYEKLEEVSVKLNVKSSVLINNKKEGFAKLFVNVDLGIIIAFTTKRNKTRIVYTDTYDTELSGLKSIELIKEPIQLEMDSVLEKITKYGIDSLNKNEKEFLDNLSK